jgi:VanZ family protein
MKRAARVLWWVLVLLYAAFMFWVSSIPPIQTGTRFADKIFHFCEYFFFSLLLLKAITNEIFRRIQRKELVSVILIGMAYAASDELHQAFVPGRTPSIFDWGADVAGIVGMLTLMFISIKWRGRAVKYETA